MPSTTNVSGTPAAIALIVSLSLWLFLSNRRGRGSSPIGGRLLVDRHTGDSRENLFLTYSSADRVPPETLARFVEAARPYFEVRFYDDDECVRALDSWDHVFPWASDNFRDRSGGATKAICFGTAPSTCSAEPSST
jgi:hypothetical protein